MIDDVVLVFMILYLREVMGLFDVSLLLDWSRRNGVLIMDFILNSIG